MSHENFTIKKINFTFTKWKTFESFNRELFILKMPLNKNKVIKLEPRKLKKRNYYSDFFNKKMMMKFGFFNKLYFFTFFGEILAKEYINVCYYTSWAQYRTSPATFVPSDIDPHLASFQFLFMIFFSS